MNLIESDDPRYFEQTSDEPYDRHIYRLHLTNGKYVDFENYDMIRSAWFQTANQFLSHVEVLNNPNYEEFKPKPKSKATGFK